jgi:hypothetical protein
MLARVHFVLAILHELLLGIGEILSGIIHKIFFGIVLGIVLEVFFGGGHGTYGGLGLVGTTWACVRYGTTHVQSQLRGACLQWPRLWSQVIGVCLHWLRFWEQRVFVEAVRLYSMIVVCRGQCLGGALEECHASASSGLTRY